MSVKSAIFNSLFTTCQKINIAVSRSLIDFHSNIRAFELLSRCSLELSMGVWLKVKIFYLLLYSITEHAHTLNLVNRLLLFLLLGFNFFFPRNQVVCILKNKG